MDTGTIYIDDGAGNYGNYGFTFVDATHGTLSTPYTGTSGARK